ncbi:TatD family hydrolase, partial [Endozoicomonas sp. SESOKO3]|uniref:TatD family hydrolase n=1 Tax=Endozoicomonas sp. SESOKO3 TaxID=2828744 RepID=UPI00214827C6
MPRPSDFGENVPDFYLTLRVIMKPKLVDIGVNLTDEQFSKDRDQVMERAIDAGVHTMILTGTSVNESQQALELAQQYSDYCYSTAGIHPHYAKNTTDSCYE